jgi:hypothetical protein
MLPFGLVGWSHTWTAGCTAFAPSLTVTNPAETLRTVALDNPHGFDPRSKQLSKMAITE